MAVHLTSSKPESDAMTSDTRSLSQDSSNTPIATDDPIGQALNQAVDSFRARLLDLRTMPWSLRFAVALVFLAILTLGATVALRDTLPGFQDLVPFAIGDASTGSRDVVLSSPIFVVALAALGLVWALLLTGAIHSRWYVRLPALIVFSLFGFIEAGVGLPLGDDAAARLTGGESLALSVQVGVFALVWLRAIAVGFVQWRAERRGEAPSTRLAGVTFVLMAVALGAHYWFAWSAASEAGQADLLTGFLGAEVTFLFLPLIPLIFIAGSDIAEIGVSLGDGAMRLLQLERLPWLLALANVVVAGGVVIWIILGVFNDTGTAYDPLNLRHNFTALVLAAILLGFGCLFALAGWGIFALVRRVGRLETAPRATPPFRAYLLATVILGLGIGLGVALYALIPVAGVVALLVPALGFGVGLALLAAQRQRPGALSLTGLLITLTSSVGFFALYNQANGGEAPVIAVALATLATVLWLLIRARMTETSVPLLAQLFTLNVGVLVIAAILAFFGRTPSAGGRIGGVAALVLVGAFVWDLVTSGRTTNATGRYFPRHVRIYLYLGYTLLLTTLTVLLAAVSFNNTDTATIYDTAFNQTQYGRFGLLALGVSTLFATFILRMSRAAASGRPQRPQPPALAPYPTYPAYSQTPPHAPNPPHPNPQ
jgi:hypothetical protein